METMFATCPNCSSPMKLELTRDVTKGEDICFQMKVAEIYEGECSLCNLKMKITKPVEPILVSTQKEGGGIAISMTPNPKSTHDDTPKPWDNLWAVDETKGINMALNWLNENKTHIVEIEFYDDFEDVTKPGDKWETYKLTGKKTITIEIDMRKKSDS